MQTCRKRTACFSANLISPFQSRAFPSARERGCSTLLSLAGSGTTSRDQVSGTSPISRSFSGGSLATPAFPLSRMKAPVRRSQVLEFGDRFLQSRVGAGICGRERRSAPGCRCRAAQFERSNAASIGNAQPRVDRTLPSESPERAYLQAVSQSRGHHRDDGYGRNLLN